MSLYHLAEPEHWAAAAASGQYTRSTLGLSLAEVGFIHLSTEAQWPLVRQRWYADYPGPLLLLTLDPARLAAPVREEVGNPHTGDLFPHLYGPLPIDAVVALTELPAPHGRP